ncbi:MAG: GntR family transcriptional regulator [Rhodospirillales bacterium]
MTENSSTPTAGKRSMVDAAYSELRERILHNIMPPGQSALEEELALQLGMSRTPVREALIRLANDGLVDIIPRRGIRVREVTARDIREINEVLGCLEVQAAERLAARRPGEAEIAQLEEAVRAMDDALEAEDMIAWSRADYRFHCLIIDLCGNRHLAETARLFLDKAHRSRLLTLPYRTRPVYSNVNHAAVLEAIRRGDSQTAGEIHGAHKRRWTRELNDIIDRMDVASDSDSHPVD